MNAVLATLFDRGAGERRGGVTSGGEGLIREVRRERR